MRGERFKHRVVPTAVRPAPRSEEHTSELQSLRHLVCRLLLEKKKIFEAVLRHTKRQDKARGGFIYQREYCSIRLRRRFHRRWNGRGQRQTRRDCGARPGHVG